MRWILASIEKLWDRALCVAGAVVFSQIPEFFQQYLQRLGGHLDEARRQLDLFTQVAARSGWTLDQLIADAGSQTDPAMGRLGHLVADTRARVDVLSSTEGALRGASLWSRPFVFVRHLDPAIARATLSVFRPAVPTTMEGLVYAGVGMALFLLIYHAGIRYPVQRAVAARRARKGGAVS